LPNGFDGGALIASSTNGLIATGSLQSSSNENAGLWSNGSTPVSLANPPGTLASAGLGMSADGSVIVGNLIPDASFVRQGFRWTSASGTMTQVPLIAGSADANAIGVSADGNKVLVSTISAGSYIWTVSLGTTASALTPVGGTDFNASAISADGTTVLGISTLGVVLWNGGTVTSLAAKLQGLNVDVGTFSLSNPTALSTNGKTVVGTGATIDGASQGYVVTLP
jgi:uncharacterized membrane protein